MIKRRFYKQEHVDHDGASDDSSSSSGSDSDSDPPPQDADTDDDGAEEGEAAAEDPPPSPPSRSGYESEDSSGNEVGCDSSGLPVNEEECSEDGRVQSKDPLIGEVNSKVVDKAPSQIPDPDSCILKLKSVFKCKLCPRIVCLSEDTIKAHLASKRHARSKKLLGEGRLRLRLNSDGEIEEEQETHAERHARTVALAQEKQSSEKKEKGRKRPRKRRIKKKHNASDNGESKEKTKKERKKKRKVED